LTERNLDGFEKLTLDLTLWVSKVTAHQLTSVALGNHVRAHQANRAEVTVEETDWEYEHELNAVDEDLKKNASFAFWVAALTTAAKSYPGSFNPAVRSLTYCAEMDLCRFFSWPR
jgi:hypothetical protein